MLKLFDKLRKSRAAQEIAEKYSEPQELYDEKFFDRPLKPATKQKMMYGRIVIYAAAVVIVIAGIVSIYMKITESPESKKPIIIYQTENQEDRRMASAFAVSFVKEFLTFKGSDQQEHRNRIEPYIADYLGTSLVKLDYNTSSNVINATAWKVEKLTGGRFDVTVEALVEVAGKKKAIFVLVPVKQVKESYTVDDCPNFVQEPRKSELVPERYQGNPTTDIQTEVEPILRNFFKSYFEGNATQIQYFLSDDTKLRISEFDQKFQLVDVDKVYTYTDTSVVELYVKDFLLNTEFKQTYLVKMKKKGGRWYITDLIQRTNDFREKGVAKSDSKQKK